MKLSNLTVRILTSLILLPPILCLILLADPIWLALTAVVFCGLAGFEFSTMTLDANHRSYRVIAALLGSVLTAGIAAYPLYPILPLVILMTLAPLCLGTFMFTSPNPSIGFRNASASICGILYTGGLFGAIALIPFSEDGNGRFWLLLLLSSVILNDTCAYAAGRAFGRHPLHPVLSPKKTREGSLGGLLGSIAGAMTVQHLFLPDENRWIVLILALALGVVSQVGDLMESFIKRSAAVKDAGQLLPGHGGILDRLDGLILCAPVLLLFLLLR